MATKGLDNKISNIIGAKLPQWVLDQLGTRSNKNTQDSRDNDNLLYLANKSAWVRLVSSIDIKDDDLRYFKKNVGDTTITKENSLAKEFVLFGGTSKYLDKNSYQQRAGLGKDGAYGILGEAEIQKYGYKPMPGITSVNIETQGRLGSIRAATINFKCWDKNQLDIMDALYFKLGFTMFLEWGHTFFYPNPQNSQKLDPNKVQSTELYSIDPFQENLNKEDILSAISQNSRNSQGNYDAMLGIATNFNFTYNQDGGYDCSLRLMALGILGDSIKINNPGVLPDLLTEEILQLQNTLLQISLSTGANDALINDLKDQQNKIDLKEKSILAFLNSKINPSTIPGVGGGYPDPTEKLGILDIAGILNSSFNKTTAKVEDYDFIRDLSGNLGYTLFSQKFALEIPSGDTATYISSITLDRNKLAQKLNSIYYAGSNTNFSLNPQTTGFFNPQTALSSLPLEKLISLDSNQRSNIAGFKSDTIWKTYDLSYVGKNNKRYIIKIEVDLPNIEYNSPNPDPNRIGLTPGETVAIQNSIYYPYNQKALFDETINFILNSTDFNPVFKVEDTKVFIGLTRDVLSDINIQGLVDLKTKKLIPEIDVNSTNVTTGNPGETYAFSLRGTYIFKAKQFTSTSTTNQSGTTRTAQYAEQDSKEPVEYRIYISDTELISDLQPGADESLVFSDYLIKLAAQNQAQVASQQTEAPPQKPTSTQIAQALNYQSSLEIILRTIEVHALNKAINEKGSPDLTIGKKVYTNEFWKDKSGKKQFAEQIFSTGVFSTFIRDLINNDIKPKDNAYTTEKKMDPLERFKIQSKYGFSSNLMGNKAALSELAGRNVNFQELLRAFVVPYQINQEIIKGTQTNHPVYIPLGLLLMILNHTCTIYDTKKDFQTPLVYIDFNPELNFFLTNSKQLSTNPWKTLIPFEGTFEDYKQLFDKDILDGKKGDAIKPPSGSTESTPLFNPKTDDKLSGSLPKLKKDKLDDNVYRGKVMNILLNVDYLVNLTQQYSAKDSINNVYLKPFLEQLLSDLNKYLGNFNAFRLSYSDSGNTFQITDDQFVPSLPGEDQISPTNRTEIPLIGKFSIAKSLEIKTEMGSKLANMLAISANSDIKNKSTLSTNGSNVGYINANYTDRYISNRQEPTGSGDKSRELDTLKTTAAEFNQTISDFYSKINPSEATVSHATSYYIDKMSRIKNDDSATRASAMIPVSLNFTTDGIAGMSMGQAFTVSEELLPYTYSIKKVAGAPIDYINKVGFVMVGLTHTIESNQWNTAVRANMIFLKDATDFKGSVSAVEDRVGEFGIDTSNIIDDFNNPVNTGPCSDPYTNIYLNRGWTERKQQFQRTVIDPKIEGPKLVATYGKVLAQAIIATIKIEQNFRGFNYNFGGFDITNSGISFNPKYHNGYVVAKEGGTGLCKAYVSFISFDTFIEQIADKFRTRGAETADTADKWANLWYSKWNGYGARQKYPNRSSAEVDTEAINHAITIWNEVSKYV